MIQNELEFSFKARYSKLGDINEDTEQVWFVVHGYGQLAHYFIRKFAVLENKNTCIIAPEGLSRFYVNELREGGFRDSDRVGATWMTKENRQMDIDNYLSYLDAVYQKEMGTRKIKSITLLGFSQGAATVSRWAVNGNVHFDRLIIWAGVFPGDMNFDKGKELLQSKEIIQVYGTNDPFIDPDRLNELESFNQKLNIHPKRVAFEGKHEIDEATLRKLI
jgi:predicted esterase